MLVAAAKCNRTLSRGKVNLSSERSADNPTVIPSHWRSFHRSNDNQALIFATKMSTNRPLEFLPRVARCVRNDHFAFACF